MDVGPTQVLYAGKQRIRTFNKETLVPDNVLNIEYAQFFAAGAYTLGQSDPDVVYDHETQRWFQLALSLGGLGTSTMTLAVSDYNESNPGVITADTVWSFYVFHGSDIYGPTSTLDYQKLGVDKNAIYLGTNVFDVIDYQFFTNAIVVIDKESLLGGGSAEYTVFNNLTNPGAFADMYTYVGPTAIQCANNYDTGPFATPYGWLADTDGSAYYAGDPPIPVIYVFRIDNSGPVPTMTRFDLPIPPFVDLGLSPLRRVHLKGGLKAISGGNTDFTSVMNIHNGILWGCCSLPVDQFGDSDPNNPNLDRIGLRWFAIDVSNPVPAIVDMGTIWDPAFNDPHSYWYSAMMATPSDEYGYAKLLLSASAGGSADYWNNVIWTANINLNNKTLGNLLTNFTGPITVTEGNTPWNPTQDFLGDNKVYRDGDYHQCAIDPIDNTLWTTGEFAYDPINWGVSLTQVFPYPVSKPEETTTK